MFFSLAHVGFRLGDIPRLLDRKLSDAACLLCWQRLWCWPYCLILLFVLFQPSSWTSWTS